MDAAVVRDDGARAGVGDEGELVIGGPGVMLGYWGLPERTAAVRSAVVAALPDDEIGSRLHAAVSPEDGLQVDTAELTTFLLERLARYAVPDSILVLPELPTTSTGKSDRTAVLALILASQRQT